MGKPTFDFLFIAAALAAVMTKGSKRYLLPEYIGFKRRTRRTETSQYPKERKSTETPLVVASERGPGLTVK